MARTCSLLDGTFGLRGALPLAWELQEAGGTHAVWRTPDGDVVVLQHVAAPLTVDAGLLDDYRQDLRLLAAARRGGLVSCELDEAGGVTGITKAPREGGQGCSIRGHRLLPAAAGHLDLGVLAHEGPVTGVREAGVLLDMGRPGEGLPRDWLGDPYGGRVRRPPRDTVFQRLRLPRGLMLRSRSDDARFDALYPGHPLSRVRRALAAVQAGLERTERPAAPAAPGRLAVAGVELAVPRGFAATEAGRLPLGQVFQRFTFAERATFLTVRRHPGEAAAARSAEGGRTLVTAALTATGSRLLQGPRVAARAVGERDGVYVEHETRASQRELYTAAFYAPWGDDALEVACAGERDDWERANRLLESVVGSLTPVAPPPGVPAAVADPEPPRGISDGGLRRIYATLCTLAHCDGAVAPEERSVLDAYQARYGIQPAEARRLEGQASPGRTIRLGRGFPERDALVEALVTLVVADDVLDPAEQRRLRRIARGMGLSEQALIARVQDRLA